MQVFFCVFRYAPALIFANYRKKNKKTQKLNALSDLLRGIPPQSLRVRAGTVAFGRSTGKTQ